ncbi:hypothetical protein ACWIWK_05410 [Helicobacter sp. 23-1048]
MTGKILGQGAIRGEDGVRYYYDEGAIKNLQDVQNINGCEVDFEIENGKAVDIFIIKSGKSSSESKQNNNALGQTLGNLGNLAGSLGGLGAIGLINQLGNIPKKIPNANNNNLKPNVNQQKISADNVDDFVFSGIVSNSNKEVVSDTSGRVSVNTNMFGVVSGGGKITTTHNHSTYFDIGNTSFVWNGNNPISDGDEVVVCATPTFNGRYEVQSLKNNTKGLLFEKSFFVRFMLTIPAIAIFGLIGILCYVTLVDSYKYITWIFSLLFIAYTLFGYFIFKKIKSIGFKIFVGVLFFIIPEFFPDILNSLKGGYPSRLPVYWIFMGGVISSILTIAVIVLLKSEYSLTKLANDAIKNYKF